MGFPSNRTGSVIPVFFAILLFTVHGAIPAAGSDGASGGLLDGKIFLVEEGENGRKAKGKDTYVFRNRKFHSANYEKEYSFAEGAYTATQQGDTIMFAVDIASESQGKIHWEGTVRENHIDARFTWTGRKPKWYQSTPKPTEHWARSVTGWATEDPGLPGGGSPSNLLDGKTFLVSGGAKGKVADHHGDYLVFQDGRFVSSDCMAGFDFRASTYATTPLGDGIRFRSATTSPTHGYMTWDGTIRGNVMDATMRWVQKRWYWNIDRVYWFKGQLLE